MILKFGIKYVKNKIFSYNKMKYDLNDDQLQNIVDNIKKRLIETYKDVLSKRSVCKNK